MKKLPAVILGLTLVTTVFGLIGCEAPKIEPEKENASKEHDPVHEAYIEALKAQKTMKEAFEVLDKSNPKGKPDKHQ